MPGAHPLLQRARFDGINIIEHDVSWYCSINDQRGVQAGLQEAGARHIALRSVLPRDLFSHFGLMHAEAPPGNAPAAGGTSAAAAGTAAPPSTARAAFAKACENVAAAFVQSLTSPAVADAVADERARDFIAKRLPPSWLPPRPVPPLDDLPDGAALRCAASRHRPAVLCHIKSSCGC